MSEIARPVAVVTNKRHSDVIDFNTHEVLHSVNGLFATLRAKAWAEKRGYYIVIFWEE